MIVKLDGIKFRVFVYRCLACGKQIQREKAGVEQMPCRKCGNAMLKRMCCVLLAIEDLDLEVSDESRPT